MIWETFRSLIVFPVFLVLWLTLGLLVLLSLPAYDVPLVEEYYGILVTVVLVVPIVVLVLYMNRSQNSK